MEEIVKKNKCTGCTACMNNCPKGAINFEKAKDGFKYPVIDKKKCINCALCKKVCPVLNTSNNESINKCYVGYNSKSDERLKASSGSVFSLIAEYILNIGGIVVGAAFDKENHLKHIAVEKKEDLEPLKKSKYLQSDLEYIFSYIKDQIKERKVLFVGTPCQVAGIKSFIKNNENLITIDLICHGVPSPKLFEKYVKELEIKNNDKLINYDFRDKSTGWNTYSNKAQFKNKEIVTDRRKNEYMQLFLSDIALRESCYNCNFKLGNKYSDITLGDFWGIKKCYPEMYNKEGVSAIIINTEAGCELFDSICNKMNYKKCKIDEIMAGNPSLKKSTAYNKKRELFFKDIDNLSFYEIFNKYKEKLLFKKIRNKIKKILRK